MDEGEGVEMWFGRLESRALKGLYFLEEYDFKGIYGGSS